MIEAHIDASGLLAKAQAFDRNLQIQGALAVEATAQSVAAAIPTYWTKQTGAAAESIGIIRLDQMAFRVSSGSKIVRFLNNGTRSHYIRPKAARGFQGPVRESQSRGRRNTPRSFLKFVVNGRTVFRRQVFHKGTKRLGFESIEANRARSVVMPALMRDARDRAIRASGF